MKKFIPILVLFLSVSNVARSQTYHPFSTTTASWLYRYYDDFHNWTPCTIGFRMNGDTLIGSVSYKVIHTVGGGCASFPAGYPFLNVYIRESGKKVFIRTDTSGLEFLFFDFNAVANDTLHNLFLNDPSGCITADVPIGFTDSMLCGGGYRKYYYAGCTQIIEGIGSISNGFLPAYCCSVSGGYVLECYSDSTETNIYPDGVGGGCLYLGLNEGLETNKMVFSFTNPFYTSINLVFKERIGRWDLLVYDVLGKKIFEGNGNDTHLIINTSEWDNGFYYLVLRNEKTSQTLKLIKQ